MPLTDEHGGGHHQQDEKNDELGARHRLPFGPWTAHLPQFTASTQASLPGAPRLLCWFGRRKGSLLNSIKLFFGFLVKFAFGRYDEMTFEEVGRFLLFMGLCAFTLGVLYKFKLWPFLPDGTSTG